MGLHHNVPRLTSLAVRRLVLLVRKPGRQLAVFLGRGVAGVVRRGNNCLLFDGRHCVTSLNFFGHPAALPRDDRSKRWSDHRWIGFSLGMTVARYSRNKCGGCSSDISALERQSRVGPAVGHRGRNFGASQQVFSST